MGTTEAAMEMAEKKGFDTGITCDRFILTPLSLSHGIFF